MLETVVIVTKTLLGISLVCLLAGLYRPWYVLWFLSSMNRLKVIKSYGGTSMLLAVLLFLLNYISD